MLHLVDLALNTRSLFQNPLYFPLVSLPYSIKGDTYISLFSLLPKEYIREFSGKNVEIVSLIFDEENSIVKIGRDRKDFSKLPEGNMYYSNFTSLYPGEYKCRLVLRNTETGQGAVASSSVIVPKGLDHGIKLYPPLLLKPETDAFYLREPTAVYPFDTSQYFPLVGQLEQGTTSVLVAVRCSFSGIKPSERRRVSQIISFSVPEIMFIFSST